jgi:hypothetical protein
VCGFVVLASADADGRADVTPRGGPRGLRRGARTSDDRHPGRHRQPAGSTPLRNVVQTGQLGMLALLPGRGQTLASTAGLREHRPGGCSAR